MDFNTRLPVSTNWKGDTYNLILVIINWLTKMVDYKLVKVTIDALSFAEVVLVVLIRHHGLSNLIVSDWGSVFTSKFWSSLCYFFGIKQRLSITFYLQTNGQTERQNNSIEAYLQAFDNFEQNDWAKLLLMAEFAYNNVNNTSTGHIPLNWTAISSPESPIKKTLISTPNQNL